MDVALVEQFAEIFALEEALEHGAVASRVGGVGKGVVFRSGKATVAIVKDPPEGGAVLKLPLQGVVLGPVEVGGIGFQKDIVDEVAYIDA